MKIGIDLGTTTSEISYLDGGVPKIFQNLQEGNSTIIPSVVSLNKDGFRVGNLAKKNSIVNSNCVIENIKNYMGSNDILKLGDKNFRAEYLSAVILKRLKEIAEYCSNDVVEELIIGVPASFDTPSRKATKDAARIVGFNNIKLINEPTAAALAYGISSTANETVLVYDFGGGTFDVSILEVKDGTFKVLATNGDRTIGGNTINNILFETIISLFENSVGVAVNKSDKRLMRVIDDAIENSKKELSFISESNLVIPNIAIDNSNKSLDLNVDLSRNDFEYLIDEVIEKTIKITNDTINSINIEKNFISKVLLVGGTTRMPIIKNKLSSIFGNRIVQGINPEEIVAKGAILSSLEEFKDENKIKDVLSNNIGIEVINGNLDVIVEENKNIPCKKTKVYQTIEDNQEVALINVFEGKEGKVNGLKLIGRFELDDIPKSIKGKEKIDLTFNCQGDGTVLVNALIKSNDKFLSKNLSLLGLSDIAINELTEKLKNDDVFNSNDDIKKEINANTILEEKYKSLEIEKQNAIEEKVRLKKERDEAEKERLEKEKKLKEEKIRLQKKEEENIERERLILKQRAEAEKLQKEKEAERIKSQNIQETKSKEIKFSLGNKVQVENNSREDNTIKNLVIATESQIENINQEVDTSSVVEKYDPSRDGEIYEDIKNLTEYYKAISPNLDMDVKNTVNDLIGDLVRFVKKDDIRGARSIENEILSMIYRG